MVSQNLQKFVALLSLSEPKPLEDTSPTPSSLSVKTSQISPIERNIGSELNATLLLFPTTIKSTFWLAQEKCALSLQHNTVSLSTETCLSGDYELASNLMITSPPRCSNGHTPAMMLYDQQGCYGTPLFQSTGPKDIPLDTCLKYQMAKEWSLVFRCDIWPELINGAERHEIAIPPRDPEDPSENRRNRGQAGQISKFNDAKCSSPGAQIVKPEIVATDKCIQTSGFGLQISRPAVCPSGKRARLARFSDSNCDSPLERDSVIKMYDSEVGVCLETGVSKMNAQKINSVSFHCWGIETELEEIGQAQIYTDRSPPACQGNKTDNSRVKYEIPKTVKVDTCVEIPHGVQINRLPTCPDGTRVRFARFADAACEVAFTEGFILDIEDRDVGSCLDERFRRDKQNSGRTAWALSMVFWCEGSGNYRDEVPVVTPSISCPRLDILDYERVPYGGMRGQVSCIGIDHKRLHPAKRDTTCPEDAGTLRFWDPYFKDSPQEATLLHTLPDTCVHVRRVSQWGTPSMKVLNPGRCRNGRRPVLKLFRGSECEDNGYFNIETISLTPERISGWLGLGESASVALSCGEPVVDFNVEQKWTYAQLERDWQDAWWGGKKEGLIALWVLLGLVGSVILAWGVVYFDVWEKVTERLPVNVDWRAVLDRKRGPIFI